MAISTPSAQAGAGQHRVAQQPDVAVKHREIAVGRTRVATRHPRRACRRPWRRSRGHLLNQAWVEGVLQEQDLDVLGADLVDQAPEIGGGRLCILGDTLGSTNSMP